MTFYLVLLNYILFFRLCICVYKIAIMNFRTTIRPKGGERAMNSQAVGQRIKAAREAKNLSQEDLATLVDLSPTHISVIERGIKNTKLDKFVAIANALEVSADSLLVDVVEHSLSSVSNQLYDMICKLPKKEQKRILNAVKAFLEE